MGWLETECPEVHVHESRRPVLEPEGSRAGVRVPVVAMKRVTTVEPRGAGRWKREGNTTANQPAGSARRLNKAEKSRPQWAWTEASVWTERMLATLERGIKGGKWYSLMDKVWKMENLQRAVAKVTPRARARRSRTAAAAGDTPSKANAGCRSCRRTIAKRPIPAAARATGLDTQAGEQRTAAVGDTDGGKPGGGNGGAQRDRTDFRARLCRSTATDSGRDEEPRTRCGECNNCWKQGKSWVVDADLKGYFDFLGYHFERSYRWPRPEEPGQVQGSHPRQNAEKPTRPDTRNRRDLNRTMRGWMGYFKHSIGNIFPPLDKWIRGRMRTILRKRHQGKGRARGRDHQRWPNAYFAELGLISLALTRAQAANALNETH